MSTRVAIRLFWSLILVIALLTPATVPVSVSAASPDQEETMSWLEARQSAGIIYFLYGPTPAVIKRYDSDTNTWLPDITSSRMLLHIAVDADGLYIAESHSLYRLNLDGSGETHLYDLPENDRMMTSLLPAGELFFANVDHYGLSLIVLRKATGELLNRCNDLFNCYLQGISVAPNHHLIAGRTARGTPSHVIGLPYQTDGTLGTLIDGPYHGDFPESQKTWFFPDESMLLDGSGVVLSAADMTFRTSLGRSVEDVAFDGNLPVILNGGNLYSYSARLLETGYYIPLIAITNIFMTGHSVLAFAPAAAGSPPLLEIIQSSAFQPAPPASVIDPNSLPFLPDRVELGNDGVLYLLHAASRNIFRWDVASRSYLPSIPLVETPRDFTFDESNGSLYVVYDHGNFSTSRISRIIPSLSMTEQPFANILLPPHSKLVVMDGYLLINTGTGQFPIMTLDVDGNIASYNRRTLIYTREFHWSPAKRRVYLASEGSPFYIHYMTMDVNGNLGITSSSQPLDQFIQREPVRLSLDGAKILIGEGWVFDGDTLNQIGTLPTAVSDGFWTADGGLYTLRPTSGGSQVQRWDAGFTEIGSSDVLVGNPLRLFSTSGGLVILTTYQGQTRISILDESLNILATPPQVIGIQAYPTQGDAPLEVQFYGQVVPQAIQDVLVAYNWDFGDGQVATGANPTHTYAHNGVYTVRLTASSQDGQDIYTAVDLITVNPTMADFNATPLSGFAPLDVQFTNLTNGTVFDFIEWDFGDGLTSNEMGPLYTYQFPGLYTVTLTMRGPGGELVKTAQNLVQVYWVAYMPVVGYQYDVLTRPGTYTFNRCGTFPIRDPYGSIAVYVTECVQSITVREDGFLMVNYTWQAAYQPSFNECLTKYSDLDNHNMYMLSSDGQRYDFIDAGDNAGYINCMVNHLKYSGWFLFRPLITHSAVLTFYDSDNQLALTNLAIPLK